MAFTPVATWGGEHAPFQLQGKKSLLHVRGHDRIHDALHGYAGGHLGFYGDLRVANASITRRCGIGLLDLPDRLWRDAYEDRLHPAEAADAALEEAAEEMGFELPCPHELASRDSTQEHTATKLPRSVLTRRISSPWRRGACSS